MNERRESFREQSPRLDLDRLLDATEDSCDFGSASRLQQTWRNERQVIVRRRLHGWLRLAAAAMVTCGLAAALWYSDARIGSAPKDVAVTGRGVMTTTAGDGATGTSLPVSLPTTRTTRSQIGVREPTVAERLVALQGRRVVKRTTADIAREQEAAARVARANELVQRMRGTLVADRMAAATALGTMADAEMVSGLATMTREPGLQREAVIALMASPTAQARAFLESDSHLQGLKRSIELQGGGAAKNKTNTDSPRSEAW